MLKCAAFQYIHTASGELAVEEPYMFLHNFFFPPWNANTFSSPHLPSIRLTRHEIVIARWNKNENGG